MDSIFVKEEDNGDSDIDLLADSSMRCDDPMELGRFTAENPNFDDDSKANIDRLKEELEESLNNQEERDTSWELSSSSRPKEKKKEKSKKELEEEEREKMQVLVSNFTEDQLNHYEMFRRAAFPKAAIKREMETRRESDLRPPEAEASLARTMQSVQQVRQTYEAACQQVLTRSAFSDAAQACDHERAAIEQVEVVAAAMQVMRQADNRVLLDSFFETGMSGLDKLAALLPEWRLHEMEIAGWRAQCEFTEENLKEAKDRITELTKQLDNMVVQLNSRTTVPLEKMKKPIASRRAEKRGHQGSAGRDESIDTSTGESNDDNEDPEYLEPTIASSIVRRCRPSPGFTSFPMAAMKRSEDVTVNTTKKFLCPICLRPPTVMRGFRCASCKAFWERLIKRSERGHLVNYCYPSHTGVASTCSHCRRTRYELEFTRRYPGRRLPIPSVAERESAAKDIH